jgi:hypothetical protein
MSVMAALFMFGAMVEAVSGNVPQAVVLLLGGCVFAGLAVRRALQ